MLRGAGIGLRLDHAQALLKLDPTSTHAPDWLELLADNHFSPAAERLAIELSRRYPVVLHCVGMNLGSCDPLDHAYVARVKRLSDATNPVHVSDHLAFTGLDGAYHHDLWPLPHTHSMVEHVSQRIQEVQTRLGRRLYVENISTYARYEQDCMSEGDFVRAIAQRTQCGIILDLNNLVVNQHNHASCARTALRTLLECPVGYVHMAGHTAQDAWLIDSHDCPPNQEVWDLYAQVLTHDSKTPALIEWDADLPDLSELLGHTAHIRTLMKEAAPLGALPLKENMHV